MNQEQIISIVRQILLAVGGFLVGKGYFDSETMVALAGAISVVIGSVWAIFSRTDKAIVQSAATKVVVAPDQQVAVGISDPKLPK